MQAKKTNQGGLIFLVILMVISLLMILNGYS
jgi:hypothetical protein